MSPVTLKFDVKSWTGMEFEWFGRLPGSEEIDYRLHTDFCV